MISFRSRFKTALSGSFFMLFLFSAAAVLMSGCSVLGQVEPPAGDGTQLYADAGLGNNRAGSGAPAAGELPSSDTTANADESSAAKDNSSGVSGNRLDDILARGYIEVATEPYFAPFEFIDPTKSEDERYVGADIELARCIADKLGVECRIVPLDFTAVLASVTEGKYDMAISALSYTPARNEALELSKGYYYGTEEIQYGLLVRTDDLDKIKSANDLGDKTIVVQSGSLQEMFAQEQVPAYKELKRVSATTDGFLMVQEEKADACITAVTTAQLYLDANPNCGMSIVPNFAFTVDEATQGTRIGLPKGETKLLDRVNSIIDEVTEQGLFVEWYNEYADYAKGLGVS